MTMSDSTSVLVPLQLSAFALSPPCCDAPDPDPARNNYKIAPIAQPNYTFLRLRDHLLTSDLLDPVDLHCTSPAELNSRLTDLGSGNIHRNRLGVYVHWTLPQAYRTGTSAATSDSTDDIKNQNDRKKAQGYPASSTSDAAQTTILPDFRPVPNRWLITRRLNKDKMEGKTLPPGCPQFQSWVVESDRLSNINDPDMDETVDLETDRTPFINPRDLDPKNGRIIEGQAEIFIGRKTPFESWRSSDADQAPHVDLNILTSSNSLFPDYVVQNMNVFSIVDDFSYREDPTNPKSPKMYLQHAWADYHVIGWHSKATDDPFNSFTDPNNPNVKAPKHSDRLRDCRMQLKNSKVGAADKWLGDDSSCRVLCHASMYDVEYNFGKEPGNVVGRTAGKQILEKHPIAVGTTPMDALLAFCQSHLRQDEDQGTLHDVEMDLLRVQTLLREAENDDVDGIQAAVDENLEQAFLRFEGGTLWHYNQKNDITTAPAKGQTRVPTVDQIKALQNLNENQAVLDNANRETAIKRWQLFAEWWNYVSGFISGDFLTTYQKRVADLYNRLNGLLDSDPQRGRLAYLQKRVNDIKASTLATAQGTDNRFYQPKDPTLLLANIDRGWDPDFIDVLNVRLNDQAFQPTADPNKTTGWGDGPENYTSFVQKLVSKLDPSLQTGATALLMEFFELRPSNAGTAAARPPPQVIPWFHNEDVRTSTKNGTEITFKEDKDRDQWNGTQPWRPLYIEWEALYYHIPFEKYSFKEYNRFSNWGTSAVRYGIDENLSDPPGKFQNVSHISGRNFLLPQTSSTLATHISEVFKNTNPGDLINLYNLPQTEQAKVVDAIANLQIVTAPMTGLTSHMLTMRDGAHVKPLVQMQNQNPVVIQAAADSFKDVATAANLDPVKLISSMDVQTMLTPYGNSVALENDKSKPPLKPVTHGQLMFTQMNIIDKFGQAVAVIDPRPPRRDADHPTMNPCISDTFHPGTVNNVDPSQDSKAVANVVHAQMVPDACPYLSLGPYINQPARLNAAFVVKDSQNRWRKCSEWESPIWGWVVVNYADKGLQLFLADGTFYREARLGGKKKVTDGFKWLPFDPPTTVDSATQHNIVQLNHLIDKLTQPDQVYLKAFFSMINQSLDDKQVHAPQTYATFSSAIVGKPLALVNVGWSLELASEPNRNWSTNNTTPPVRNLLHLDTNAQFAPDDPAGYTFRVKLGDAERSFDGLVGYFLSADQQAVNSPTASDLDLSKLYTYFNNETQNCDPRVPLNSDVYPKFTPYYFPPGSGNDPLPDHVGRFQVFGMILDPFHPVHGYSAILPNKSIKLPDWAVEQALSKITAFFAIGPFISPTDVAATYDETRALTSDNVSKPILAVAPAIEPTVSVPLAPPVAASSGSGSAYRYLQPYMPAPPAVANTATPAQPAAANTTTSTTPNAPNLATAHTRYNPYGISPDAASGTDAAQMRLSPGPYTALEGYAQITAQVSGPVPGTVSGTVAA